MLTVIEFILSLYLKCPFSNIFNLSCEKVEFDEIVDLGVINNAPDAARVTFF